MINKQYWRNAILSFIHSCQQL